MKLPDKTWLIIIASVCLIYVALRLWRLADSCLWFDEIFSIHAAEMDWRNLFWFVAQDLIHPPFFYVLLKIWIALGGEGLFWLRLFPLLFSTLALAPFLLLCRQLKLSDSTIALALIFFAASGSLIKYAQEVRMYSLLLCAGLFSLWLFVRFLNTGKGFLILTIVNVALVYLHYFGWLVAASEVFAVLILARERLKQIFIMLGAAAISFAPWAYLIWRAAQINSNLNQNIGWMAKPNLKTILQFVFDLFEPIYFQNSNREQSAIYLLTLPIIAAALLALGFYFAEWKNESAVEKKKFSLLSIFAFAPILIAFVASWISPYSIFGTRHLIIAFAPLAVLSAIVYSKIKFAPVGRAAVAVVFLLFALAFWLQAARGERKYIWCAWENLASGLPQAQSKPPRKIYVFEDLVAYHFWFALRDSDAKFQIMKINGIEGLKEDRAYFLPRGFDEVQTASEFDGERFFVAFRAKDWNEQTPPLKNLIESGYRIGEPQIYEAQNLKAFLVEAIKAETRP